MNPIKRVIYKLKLYENTGNDEYYKEAVAILECLGEKDEKYVQKNPIRHPENKDGGADALRANP